MKKPKKKVDAKPTKKTSNKGITGRPKKLPIKASELVTIKKDVDKSKRGRRVKSSEKPKEVDNKKKILAKTKTKFPLKSIKSESGINQNTTEKDIRNDFKNGESTEILDSENEFKDEKGKKKKHKLENENKTENEEDNETGSETTTGLNKTGASNLGKLNRSSVEEKGKPQSSSSLKKISSREHIDDLEGHSTNPASSKDGKDVKKGKKEKEVLSKTVKNINNSNRDSNIHNKGKEKNDGLENAVEDSESPFLANNKPQRVSMRIRNRAERAENAKYIEKLKGETTNEKDKGSKISVEEKALEGLGKKSVSSSSVDADKIGSSKRRSGRKNKKSEQEIKPEMKQESKSEIKKEVLYMSTRKKSIKNEESKIEKESLKKKKKQGMLPQEEIKKGETGIVQTKKDIHKKELEKGDYEETLEKKEKKIKMEKTIEAEKKKEKTDEPNVEENEDKESSVKTNESSKGERTENLIVIGESRYVTKIIAEKKGNDNTSIVKQKIVDKSVKKNGWKQDRLGSSMSSIYILKNSTKDVDKIMDDGCYNNKELTENLTEEKISEITLTENVSGTKEKEEKNDHTPTENNKKQVEVNNKEQVSEVKIEAPVVEKKRGRKRKIDKENELLNKMKNLKENENEKLGNNYMTYAERKNVILENSLPTISSDIFVDNELGDADGIRRRISGRRSALRNTSIFDREGKNTYEYNKDGRAITVLSRRKLKEEDDELYTLQGDSFFNPGRSKRKYVKRKYKKRFMDVFNGNNHISSIRNNFFQSSLNRRLPTNTSSLLKYNKIGNKQDKNTAKSRLFPNETFMNKEEFLNNVNSISTVYSFNEEFLNFLSTVSKCDDIQYKFMLQFLGTIQLNLSQSLSREYSNEFFVRHNVNDTVQVMEHLVNILNNNKDILNKLNQLEYKFFNDLLEKVNDQDASTLDGLMIKGLGGVNKEVNGLNNMEPVKMKLREFFERRKNKENGIDGDHVNSAEKEYKTNEKMSIENRTIDTLVEEEKTTKEEIERENTLIGNNCIQNDLIDKETLVEEDSSKHITCDVRKGSISKFGKEAFNHPVEEVKLKKGLSEESSDDKEKMENKNKYTEETTAQDYFKRIDIICGEFTKIVESTLKNENSFSLKSGKSRYENATEESLYKNYISTKLYKDCNIAKQRNGIISSIPLTNYNILENIGDGDDVFLKKYMDFFKENNYINTSFDLSEREIANKNILKDKTNNKDLPLHMDSRKTVCSILRSNTGDEDILRLLSTRTEHIEKEEDLIDTYKNCVEEKKKSTDEISSLIDDFFASSISVLRKVQVKDEKGNLENKNMEKGKENDSGYEIKDAKMEIKTEESIQKQCLKPNEEKYQTLCRHYSNDDPQFFRQQTMILENENENLITKSYSDTIAINSSNSMSDESRRGKIFDNTIINKGDKSGEETGDVNKKTAEQSIQKVDEKKESNTYIGLKEVTKDFINKSTHMEKWDETYEAVLPEHALWDNKELTKQKESADYTKNLRTSSKVSEKGESNVTASLQEQFQAEKSAGMYTEEERNNEVGYVNAKSECWLKEEKEDENKKCLPTTSNTTFEKSTRIPLFLKKDFTYRYNGNTFADLLEETFNLTGKSCHLINNTEKSPKEILDCLYMISKIKKTFFDECTKMINNQIFLLEKNFQIPNCNLSILKNSFGFNNAK